MKKLALLYLILLGSTILSAQYLEVTQSSYLKSAASGDAENIFRPETGDYLWLLNNGERDHGYYYVRVPGSQLTGYIYRSKVRRYEGVIPGAEEEAFTVFIEDEYIEPVPPSAVSYSGNSGRCVFIKNYAYISCVDTGLNLPLYVSHAIDRELVEAGELARDRPNVYSRDNKLDRLPKSAYSGKGYDHGHLAPARDFKWDSRAFFESFYMTNMAPMLGDMNRKGWEGLEDQCRNWAMIRPGIIYIVSGIIPDDYIKTLEVNDLRIPVPKSFYKVVLSWDPATSSAAGMAFIVPNQAIEDNEIPSTKTTIDHVEQLTNMDFFYFLPDSIETVVESGQGEMEFTSLGE